MTALADDSSKHGVHEFGASKISQEIPEEGDGHWYFSRKEIEENSPSRKDGIDLKKETYMRKSYCTFLQDLGMRLKVPQLTIATAIIFCHRFFLRHSLAKNDRRTIASVCMFLAGKVEETPRPLKDVILVSYEIIHKKDPSAAQRIKQKEVYEQQKELTLLAERAVLATLAFDLNVLHPYKPLVEAVKKLKVAQNALAQVAWNFVNDGLRTSLCLQFKPHHIAAGAIFLAAKFLKVKLPSDGEKVWWQEFDVTPRQLEEVSNQMLELYEQNKAAPSSLAIEAEGSVAGGIQTPSKSSATVEDHGCGVHPTSKVGETSKPPASYIVGPPRVGTQDQIRGGSEGSVYNHFTDLETNIKHIQHERELLPENRGKGDLKEKYYGRDGNKVGQSPQEVIKKIDKDKVKAALERNRKSRGDSTRKVDDYLDDDDLIERELEDGIELAAETEKGILKKKQNVEGELEMNQFDVMG
ncbi:unnamed protein product [Cuscuta europaea]|uniref:Cyclin-like domain-containing protein n=1 Tax=Cuscuta europaea TaxID=41803 RepID=A0A9P0ZTN8_CUSEU|nr:unnamed protein product [Cuscuta europaea]